MRIRILQLKKTAFAALIVMLLIVVGVTKGFAQTFTVGNLNYSVNDDGVSVTVTGHVDGQNATGELVIPESVEYDGNSFVVSLIGENAFSECAGITSLTIGNSITEIRDRAFYNCDGLEGSLSIGNSVVLLYFSVFADCDNITSITIPSSVLYIAPVAFYGCDNLNSVYFNATNCYPFAEGGWGGMSGNWIANCPSLTNIIIGEGVVNIPAYFASNCTTLTGSLTIPNSVVTIGEKAFYNCSGFTGSLTIPNSVTNIESNAFYGCTGLSDNLTLGQSLTSIGNSAFYNACENMSTFTILAETPPSLGTLVFTSVDYAIPVQVPCGSLDAYQNSDGWNAFANIQEINPCWWDITALAAPAQGGSISGAGTYEQGTTCTLTATAYGDYEFSHWTENGVTVSTNATYSFVVEGNRSLVARFTNPSFITFADPNVEAICVSNWDTDGDGFLNYEEAAAVTDLGNVFRYNLNITSFDELQYFTGLTSIRDYFISCQNLVSVVLPENITEIYGNAFQYCYSLTGDLVIPDAVNHIGYRAFHNTSFNGALTIGKNIKGIDSQAFQGASFTTLNYNAINCNEYLADDWLTGLTELLTVLNIGEDVQYIPNRAFHDCINLTDLLFPNALTTIGYGAFANCTGLTGVITLGPSIVDVAANAFFNTGYTTLIFNAVNCNSLGADSDIFDEYGNWIEWGWLSAFNGCHITTLIVGENVQRIPDRAFMGWNSINSTILTIPESITWIGGLAFAETNYVTVNFNATNCTYMGDSNNPVFANCNSLTSLHIGENVETIPEYAFYGCSGLSGSLVIPNSVTTIGRSAFRECTGYDWTLMLGNSLKHIGANAFMQCNFTGELTIPNTVEFIGTGAFMDCHGFTGTLTIGTGVTKMGPSAFRRCTGITSIHYNAVNWQLDFNNYEEYDGDGYYGTSFISHPVFNECENLSTIVIGEQVENIPPCAFMKCTSVTGELTIPASVTSVGQFAFGQMGISTVNFNATNCTDFPEWQSRWDDDGNYYEGSAFLQCSNLTNVNFGSNVRRIPANVFVNCSTLSGELAIPTSVTEIGYAAFHNCIALSGALFIPYAVVSIGNWAFAGCTGLEGSLAIPESVASIGNYAFSRCTGLSGDLTIGSSVEFIGEYAFDNTGFTTLNFNAVNCQELGYYFPGDHYEDWRPAFHNFPLTTLNFGEGVENIPFRAFRDITTLTGILTLPNSLKSIGDQAFYNCYGLESVVMGNSVENIGAEAFRNCGGLRGELILPETLLSVGNYAFASCDELTTINYNAVNCTAMGNAQQPVFYDCASMAHIKIGENVESIPNYAFKRCSAVVDMTVAATAPPTIGSSTFGTVSRSIPVTVQCSATPAFQAAQYWSEFTNYAENFNYVLQVAASDPTKGTVVVSKEASCDDPTAMVTAYPELGYAFTGWSENGTMVSQANPYSFLMESSRSLQAEFAPGVSYSVAVTLNPAVAGSVTGMGNYNDGSAVSLIATANPGYAFVNWTENGTVVSSDETYTFTIHENHNFVANFTPYAYHWDVNIHQYPNNMTAIGIIQIEGVEQATPTLEIGAFCGDECRGRQLLTYYPQVNRYLVFLMLHGNDNDELRFKLYDHGLAEELELSCTSMVTFVTNGRLGTPANPYVFNFINSQQTEMSEGWTWYSTYIEQSDVEGLQMMTEGLGENGVMIKSQTGFIANSGGEWMGNLDAITNESMYMVNTTAAGMLEMVGNSAIASQHPITLNQGWNWIGYPLATANDVNVALSGLDAHDNDILKSQEAFTTYYDGFGWMGSLNTITPGMGLMYESNNSGAVSFTYTEGRSGVLKRNVTAENNHWIPNMHKYTNNMNVMAVVELDDVELRDGRYELAVFAGEECRGSVRLMYVEPVDRYVAFLTITGHETTDLRFALFDSDEAVEYGNAKEHLVFESDVVVGNTKDMFTVHFNSQSQSYDFDQVAVYPNPADCGQNFRIAMPVGYEQNVRVEIINELGAVVSVVRSNVLPMELKAPAMPGVYTLKIVAEGHDVSIRKLVVK